MIVTYNIETRSKIVSLNQYKSLHWRKLKSKIDPLKGEFIIRIRKAKMQPLKWIELTVRHNTNFDMDNVVGTVKPFVDCLRACKVIEDDTKKQWDKLTIVHDRSLPKNCTIFEITGEILN